MIQRPKIAHTQIKKLWKLNYSYLLHYGLIRIIGQGSISFRFSRYHIGAQLLVFWTFGSELLSAWISAQTILEVSVFMVYLKTDQINLDKKCLSFKSFLGTFVQTFQFHGQIACNMDPGLNIFQKEHNQMVILAYSRGL